MSTDYYHLEEHSNGGHNPAVANNWFAADGAGPHTSSTCASNKGRHVFAGYYRMENIRSLWVPALPLAADKSGYRLLPQSTTPGTGVALDVARQEESALGVADMVTEIRQVLGLTAAQVAQVVGVSRPALYKHINNEAPRDLTGYQRLYDLAIRIRNEVGELSKGHKSVLVAGKTFVRHLCERRDDTKYLLSVAKQVATHLGQRVPGEAPDLSRQRMISRSISKGG